MKLAVFFVLIFTTTLSSAFAEDEIIVDQELLNNLDGLQNNQRKLIPTPPEERKAIVNSETDIFFSGMIKPESLLFDIKDEKKKILTTKKIFVKVKKEKDDNDHLYLLGKKGEVLYRTKKENIVDIQDVVELNPKPKHYVEFPAPREYDSGDEKLLLKSSFLIHGESFSKASASRLELKTFYGWKLPLEFGLSFSQENGKETLPEESTQTEIPTWKTYYIGPILRYKYFENEYFFMTAEASFQKSMKHERISGTMSEQRSIEAFDFGGEILFPTPFGQFIGGLHWRTLRSALDGTSDPELIVPENEKTTTRALSLSFGYGREFSW